MAAELKVSRGSLQNLVNATWALDLSNERKSITFQGPLKKKKLSRSRILLNWLANQGLDRVLFSDEKIITIEEELNIQNDRILVQ